MGKTKKEVLEGLFDNKIISVLSYLVNQNQETFLKDIAEGSGVSIATTLRILHGLEDQTFVSVRKVGRTPLYKWNSHQDHSFFEEIFSEKKDPLIPLVEQAEKDQHVVQMFVHGSIKGNKVNILVIGNHVNREGLDAVTKEIKEKAGLFVSYICLDQQQFTEMTGMGLYAGKKTMLFERG